MENLRIRRGDTIILDDISWTIRPGQHWVMLGANGSGKTSLLRALTGYFMPTAGQITLLGQKYGETDWRELRPLIGLVSSSICQMMSDQEPALESIVSGKYAVIDSRRDPCQEDRMEALRILGQIECEPLADRSWGCLSQGERQRVLIGRALMSRPKLLILDEPCAGLDPAARELFLRFLGRIGRKAKAPALILVTHHVEEIIEVFSHILVLKNGTVLASGEKKRILTSAILGEAFGIPVRLTRRNQRYSISVAPTSSEGVASLHFDKCFLAQS